MKNVCKVTIAIEGRLLRRIDQLVKTGGFASRSQAIQALLEEKLVRSDSTRLAQECAKVDPFEEHAIAEEFLVGDVMRCL
jgi:metal-responsive CopG/Arc/MetJ family transcriptional regulator